MSRPPPPLLPLLEVLLLPLLLPEREIFKLLPLLLELLPPLALQSLLILLLLLLLNLQSFRKLLMLLSLETNKVTEYLETTFPQNSAIKPNSLNYSLRKHNLHRSCNKRYNL
jgi:hypothetical protein